MDKYIIIAVFVLSMLFLYHCLFGSGWLFWGPIDWIAETFAPVQIR